MAEHATDGTNALRIDRSYVALDRPQDWTGYDYIKADVHTDAKKPLELYFEVRDTATRDYWTRVNYTTIVPPGSSTLIIPTALYVGEKSRPGRPLILNGITRMVFSIGDKPEAPLFIDNLRLERDTETAAMLFDGLWAFDLGTGTSPVMEGFTPLDAEQAATRRAAATAGRTPGSGGPSTPSSPIRSTRTSSASKPAAWPWTCPTAATTSSSTWTRPRASGASTRPTAGAR